MADEKPEQLALFPEEPRRRRPLRPVEPETPRRQRGDKLRLGVLASGQGSGLETILHGCEEGVIPAEVVLVVSNHSNAHALELARDHGVECVAVPRAGHPTRREQQHEMADHFEQAQADLIVLAGFDRTIEAEICARYSGRIINAHPSLLPAFIGLHAITDALDYGVRYTGVTVHFVDAQVAGGPVILQEPILIEPEDSPPTLTIRIEAAQEHLLAEAIRLYAQDRLRVDGRRVTIE